jgi:hypothetical protein
MTKEPSHVSHAWSTHYLEAQADRSPRCQSGLTANDDGFSDHGGAYSFF